jgi:hypothetical protein
VPQRPPNQTGSIRITAPPEAVWELMTTVDTVSEWYDTTSQHEIAPHYGSGNFTETNDIATVSVNLALARAASDNKTETGQPPASLPPPRPRPYFDVEISR